MAPIRSGVPPGLGFCTIVRPSEQAANLFVSILTILPSTRNVSAKCCEYFKTQEFKLKASYLINFQYISFESVNLWSFLRKRFQSLYLITDR